MVHFFLFLCQVLIDTNRIFAVLRKEQEPMNLCRELILSLCATDGLWWVLQEYGRGELG